MSLFRTEPEQSFNVVQDRLANDQSKEWMEKSSAERIDDINWIRRYEWERKIIFHTIDKMKSCKKVIELGSGPGKLMDVCLQQNEKLDWLGVDVPGAVELHKKKGFKGKVISEDLMNSLPIENLDSDYDMIVANDFLEHVANVSDILYRAHDITNDDARFVVSVPNWRMGHVFIYRGLFDYDNWVYTMLAHGWEVDSVYPSNLKCPDIPKLDSESTMPDDLIQSWNWYFVAKKRK